MWVQILTIGIIIIAACIVMILHEIPKAVGLVMARNKIQKKKYKNHIFRVSDYIDPIGLIFCVMAGTGFSKMYMHRIRNNKDNIRMGVTGLLSLLVVFTINIVIFKMNYYDIYILENLEKHNFFTENLPAIFTYYMALLSLNMFFVNLFPIAAFDMGVIINGKSSHLYVSMKKNEIIIKMIFLAVIFLNVIGYISGMIFELIL